MRNKGPANTVEEERSEVRDAEVPGASSKERKRGGAMPHSPAHHPRKHGGSIPGKKAKSHPGRRARGGATSDMNPTTAAGNMSEPDYEKARPGPDEGGKGADNAGLSGRD